MRIAPRAGAARKIVLAVYVIVVLFALVLFFEFVVNRRLLPANF